MSALARATPYHQRELALRFELEADCLAGVWASKSPKFAAGEGSRAAMIASLDAIGDDRILASPSGIVDPSRYYVNVPFRFKMLCLIAAITFQFTVFKRTVTSEAGESLPAWRRWLIAGVSLTLWFGVGWAGRFIAFL